MAGKLYLGWPNRIGESTLSGGAWSGSLPLANVADARITKVARSATDAVADTKIIGDYGQTRSTRAFALVNHNLSQAAQVRFRLGSTSGGAEAYDSGWVAAWQMGFDNDLLEWEDAGWWEGITDDEYLRAPYAVIHVLPTYTTARYWSIEIDDTANTDTYVQIGRVFVGGGFVPTYNYSYGFLDGWDDFSSTDSSESGAQFALVKPKLRSVQFELAWLTHAETEYVHEMLRRLGTTGEVLFVSDTDDTDRQQRYGFLGRMRKLNRIEYPYVNSRKAAFEIAEILS